jgi:hypothetical protein
VSPRLADISEWSLHTCSANVGSVAANTAGSLLHCCDCAALSGRHDCGRKIALGHAFSLEALGLSFLLEHAQQSYGQTAHVHRQFVTSPTSSTDLNSSLPEHVSSTSWVALSTRSLEIAQALRAWEQEPGDVLQKPFQPTDYNSWLVLTRSLHFSASQNTPDEPPSTTT